MRSPNDRFVKELTLATTGFEDPGLFAVLESAAETPQRYDDLTFGLVAMEHDGTVFAYGAMEAKYSGLAPARVLGRNFFTDVAPCCNNFMVSGRSMRNPRSTSSSITSSRSRCGRRALNCGCCEARRARVNTSRSVAATDRVRRGRRDRREPRRA